VVGKPARVLSQNGVAIRISERVGKSSTTSSSTGAAAA